MAHPDWKAPASEEAKQNLIGKPWGSHINTYLWYEIGRVTNLTDSEIATIVIAAFVNGKAGFGDVELHQSMQLPDHPTLLRLRGNLHLQPSLKLRGRYCPLYQVGYNESPVAADPPSPDLINFYNQWKEATAS